MSPSFYQLTGGAALWSSGGVNETAFWQGTTTNKIMKAKTLLLAALVGVAAASAQAGVSWNISIGLPLPVFCSPPVVVAAPPVVCAPPALVYAAPCPPPAPPVFMQAVPVCPSPDYVWVAGYWSYQPSGYVWVHGGWNCRPAHVMRGYYYGGGYGGHRW